MRRVLLLAPMTAEAAPVVRGLGLRRDSGDPFRRWTGSVGGIEVVLVRVGVGVRHAGRVSRQALGTHAPDHAVICGVAGGLARHLGVGDLAVPAEVVDLDSGESWSAAALGTLEPRGRLLTSATFHSLEALGSLHGGVAADALAIDMETAAIAATCEQVGVAWTALRGVSDLLWKDALDASSLDLVREDGTTDVHAVLRHTVRDPRRVAGLARMARGSAAAMAAVTSALREGLRGDALPM